MSLLQRLGLVKATLPAPARQEERQAVSVATTQGRPSWDQSPFGALNWEEKLAAFKCLSDCSLRMREPGNWYLSDNVEVGGDGFLESPTVAESTPEQAVETMWARLVTNLPHDRYLVINAMNERRRHVRWNGYMWQDLPVEQEKAA